MRLVTVAHGTRTPTGNRVARELTGLAGARLGLPAQASYVELCAPLFADVVAAASGPTVAVPLLLSTGHHVRHDLPRAVAAARFPVELASRLGPHPLLAAAQVERLLAAGADRGQPVTMVAAGSTDAAAADDHAAAGALLGRAWGGPVRVAVLSGHGPRPADVVEPGDAVSPYLLAPGFFATRARDLALGAGAAVVAEPIGVHRLVVDLVVERARGAMAAATAPADGAACADLRAGTAAT